jgi:hypothetical protein
MSLIPPDHEQCQANPNVLTWTPFSLGPMPAPVRCTARPVWLASEVVPGADGLCGSMSLCDSCANLMLNFPDYQRRIQLIPINRED